MKQMKTFSALAAGSVTIALLLGTSLAQAEELVCTEGDTVTGIKGLEVFTEEFDQIIIDVDFIWTTGYTIYGSNLDNLPFGPPDAEDDSAAVATAINQTLDAQPTIPDFAAVDGKNFYYIGVEVETESTFGATAGWLGANYIGEWGPCEFQLTDNCVAIGSAIVPAADYFVYADLKPAVSGATCDGGPSPPESDFSITPGITGSWYLEARDGEGYNIEIVGETLAPRLLAYFYTYDAAGNQMWLVGDGPVDGDTAVVPVQVTSGALYGDAFDPTDVVRQDWGTLTFTFSSCTAGSVVRASLPAMGFGTTTVDIERLTSVISLSCP
jgi:hypothetical protein